MIVPDAVLGVLGGGQLGRMFTIAARSMGYRVWVLDPDPHSPAGAMADRHLQAGYRDQAALSEMGTACAAVTTEFENVPAETLEFLEARLPVRPGSAAVATARDRIRDETFHYFKSGMKRLVIEIELQHVDVYLLVTTNTFEERMLETLSDKRELALAALDPARELGRSLRPPPR